MMQKEKTYWNKWYIALLIFLILQIILYYFITKHFHE
jgi:hypothetical protein